MSDQTESTEDLLVSEDVSGRVFLVVVDKSDEMDVALRYAAMRARNSNGRVALLHVIEDADFQHWMGVSQIMKDEARENAQALLQKHAATVFEIAEQQPSLYLREGVTREEIIRLIDEQRSISILILAAATGKNPGPLITALTGKHISQLRVPLTVVPGTLTNEDILGIT